MATKPTTPPSGYDAFATPPITAVPPGADLSNIGSDVQPSEKLAETPPIDPIPTPTVEPKPLSVQAVEYLGEARATMVNGKTLVPAAVSPKADSLHVDCLEYIEGLIVGGLLVPAAQNALFQAAELVVRLRKAVAPKEKAA